MPIYEYKCLECGSKFEALRSMKDADNVITCIKCSSIKNQRVASACFSKSEGSHMTSSSSSSSGCSGCSGGSCASCGH